MPRARVWRRGTTSGYSVSLEGATKNVLNLDCGDSCISLVNIWKHTELFNLNGRTVWCLMYLKKAIFFFKGSVWLLCWKYTGRQRRVSSHLSEVMGVWVTEAAKTMWWGVLRTAGSRFSKESQQNFLKIKKKKKNSRLGLKIRLREPWSEIRKIRLDKKYQKKQFIFASMIRYIVLAGIRY